MNAFSPFWDSIAGAWAEGMLRALAQGTLALLAALVTTRWLLRRYPEVCCWVWRVAFLKVVLAFFVAASVGVPVLGHSAAAAGPADPLAGGTLSPGLLFLVWLIGALVGVVRLGAGWCTVLRWRLKSAPVGDLHLLGVYRRVADCWGLRSPPPLRLCGDVASPMLIGVVSPVIVLPAAGADRTALDDLRLIVSHELAHYVRRDLLWEWLRTAGSVLLFFHPLVWIASREWAMAREASCDALAIRRARSDPGSYADMLLRLWRQVSGSPHGMARATFAAMGVLEEVRTARRRLRAMARCRLLGRGARLSWLVVVVALGGGLLVPWRLTAAEKPALSHSDRPGARPGGAARAVVSSGGTAASYESRPGRSGQPARRRVVISP